MDRYMKALKASAEEANQDRRLWGRTLQGNLDEEQQEQRRRRDIARENQLQVQAQIESNKSRRAETRKDFIEAASLHSFPLFTETFISETEVEAWRKGQKDAWRQELDQQSQTIKMLRNLEEKKHHDAALARQKVNVDSMTRDRRQEHSRLKKQGRELMQSWDRDVQLRCLKKAIHSGKDVLHHLPDR